MAQLVLKLQETLMLVSEGNHDTQHLWPEQKSLPLPRGQTTSASPKHPPD